MRTSFLLVACAIAAPVFADDFSGKSPSGKLAFASKNDKECYIWAADKPDAKKLLYKEEVVFIQAAAISPDDVWIALEQGGGSLGHTILFFKRQKGLDFKQFGGSEKDPDPTEKVGAIALQSKDITENILDHSYLHPVKWSDDSMWLTVALDAKGKWKGKYVRVKNWQCRYNPVRAMVEKLKDNPGSVTVSSKDPID